METGRSYWPDQGDSKRAVIDCLVPQESWGLYPFKGIKYQTDDYPKAAQKLKLLLQGFSDTSSMSEGDNHGKRQKCLVQKKRCTSSSESDEDQATYSAQQSKRSCLEKHATPPQRPTLEFIHPSSVKPRVSTEPRLQPRPATQTLGMLPQYRATHPFRALPPPAPHVQPQAGASTSMQAFDLSSEDHTAHGSRSLHFTNTLLNRLLAKVEVLMEKFQNVEHKQNQIMLLHQHVRGDIESAVMPEGLSLPLSNEQEINRLEEELLEKEFRTKFVNHLSCIGGDYVTSLVRRILRQFFSPDLACQYNFSGAKGKKSFQFLQLRKVLIAAVRKTFPAASESEVELNTRKWFANARDRDGGRT